MTQSILRIVVQAEAEAQRRQDQLQLLQSKQDKTRSEEQRLFQHLTSLRKVAAWVYSQNSVPSCPACMQEPYVWCLQTDCCCC